RCEQLPLLDLLYGASRREQRRGGRRHRKGPRTSEINRCCCNGSARNRPMNLVVTVDEPCFSTPRSDMQVCSASTITATRRGLSTPSTADATWDVRCSWV